MPNDKATSSYGVQIYSSADGSSAPVISTTAVSGNSAGEILDAKLGGIDVKEVNATHLNQSSAAMRSKPGMYDPGTLEMKLNYNGTDISALTTVATGRTVKWWLLQIPASDTDPTKLDSFQFRGWIKTLNKADMPAEGGEIVADLTVRIIGDVTFTAAP